MSKTEELTAERLREVLDYGPKTGVFTWKMRAGEDRATRSWNGKYAGKTTGSIRSDGYRRIYIDDVLHLASRLAYLHMTGAHPAAQIDHANGRPADNRWVNLRLATHQQNGWNVPVRRHSRSGVKGVRFRQGKYEAPIVDDAGRKRWLGSFFSIGMAVAAYNKAAAELHGAFARPSVDPRDPPSDADESITLLVADHAGETTEEAIARLGLSATDIAGKVVHAVDTGIYR